MLPTGHVCAVPGAVVHWQVQVLVPLFVLVWMYAGINDTRQILGAGLCPVSDRHYYFHTKLLNFVLRYRRVVVLSASIAAGRGLFFCLDAKEPKDQGAGQGASRPIICFNLFLRTGRDHMAIGRQACSAGPLDPVLLAPSYFLLRLISMGRGTPCCPWPCLRCARRRGSLAGTGFCVAFRFYLDACWNQRYTANFRRRTLSGVGPSLLFPQKAADFLFCAIAG